ncbi:MAG: dethiobiotin synthase [Nitrospiraceae bacterium]|nr:dethiobiotin synthase [Nitrospiraceae bacterium]
MPKGFFVTGTDTGVGKTIVAGAIIRAMRRFGLRGGAMKPIESGCGREGDLLIPFDGMSLKQASHMDDLITMVTPCCFEAPLAPLPASETEMRKVSIPAIRNAFSKLSAKYDAMVVEGIGGLLVPIKKNYAVIDLASDLGLPLIVVAKPGLGTINHTMLTVKYALKEGLDVAGVIINYSMPPENTPSEKTNAQVLERICPVPVIGIFPYMKNVTDEAIEKAVTKNLNLDVLRKYL